MPSERDEKLKEVRMMKSPDAWPMLPYLPLKRYTQGDALPECSHLFHGEGFLVRGKDYGSAEKLYDAGWRVD